MSKHSKRHRRPSPRRPAASQRPTAPSFTPVPVRARHDGWSPARQVAFLQVLAGCACVEEACRAVGMSPRSAYTLRARPDAVSFRQAWDVTLDYALNTLADAMIGRAIHGVATPIFYQGQQVGERRRYDERLGMFLLRTRQPERYGPGRDRMLVVRENPDGAAAMMAAAIARVAEDGLADQQGRPRPPRAPLQTTVMRDDPQVQEELARQQAEAQRQRDERAWRQTLTSWAEDDRAGDPGGDVA